MNEQKILKKQLRTLVNDLGLRCVYCFTEIWRSESDDINVFNAKGKNTVVENWTYLFAGN